MTMIIGLTLGIARIVGELSEPDDPLPGPGHRLQLANGTNFLLLADGVSMLELA